MLTSDQAKKVFSYNPITGILRWQSIPLRSNSKLKHAGTKEKSGYIRISYKSELYRAHRLAWLITYGEYPNIIDHINGDASDNRIVNLRNITRKDNLKNCKRHADNKSGMQGVYQSRRTKRWYVQIWDNKKCINLGTYDLWFDAVCARKSAENKYGYHDNHGRVM